MEFEPVGKRLESCIFSGCQDSRLLVVKKIIRERGQCVCRRLRIEWNNALLFHSEVASFLVIETTSTWIFFEYELKSLFDLRSMSCDPKTVWGLPIHTMPHDSDEAILLL